MAAAVGQALGRHHPLAVGGAEDGDALAGAADDADPTTPAWTWPKTSAIRRTLLDAPGSGQWPGLKTVLAYWTTTPLHWLTLIQYGSAV